MKRKTLRFMACVSVMALTLSVTACGGSNGSATTETAQEQQAEEVKAEVEVEELEAVAREEAQEVEAEVEEAAEEAEEASEEAAEGYATLEDYYNAPGVKAQMDSLADSMSEDGVTATVEVNGNEFIIIVQYVESNMVVDGMGEMIDTMMEALADTFKQTAAQFDEAIGQDGACTVTVRYLDPDNNVLSENSYTAN